MFSVLSDPVNVASLHQFGILNAWESSDKRMFLYLKTKLKVEGDGNMVELHVSGNLTKPQAAFYIPTVCLYKSFITKCFIEHFNVKNKINIR